ncbi:prepilin-type N-terminal cleavage/methylation domain-containing protein [Luteolibacter yonseiensis]|uniref:Prepilin-type N-terminal cleavage/methylation domain-containing protein n=1 Tax=Luteolibacter yonseiensis TaxID=1144680 RepID=A0A934R2L1_9BACT|nr:prepilin-type N-terminal cleavage/methylation domain-containing protein [Luteolibacter yonseiensis]MBK1815297.1 prepilin-type N-terminal cleavage/methylation domain-containing protein [Luteolibacter yonseiensis]
MNRHASIPRHHRKAFTLLEMTVVILVLLSLVKIGLFTSKKMDEWKLGRAASESLRSVYSAQRMYLADNPTATVASLTGAALIPYMPNNATSIPTVTSLTGSTLTIIVTVSPPVVNAGSGVTYDPSGSGNDSLWDVGE